MLIFNKIIAFCLLTFALAPSARACSYEEQIKALALNMYHEARDQGVEGMILIGEVTLNRVNHDRFPNTICDVVYQGKTGPSGKIKKNKCQFSWYCDGLSDKPKNKEVWKETVELAKSILLGEADIFGIEATHYLNPRAVSRMPKWTQVYEVSGKYGDHVFYYIGDNL